MLLNIVTIHLDNFEGLHRTLESLRPTLGHPNVRWIVVDGGSSHPNPDEQRLMDAVSEMADVFISEHDRGIYDAMNKGTDRTVEGYLLYLNAGDELHPHFDWNDLGTQLEGSKADMVWGVCHERYPNGTLVRIHNRSPALAWYGMPANHQNILFRRDRIGDQPYDTSYRILADYDLVSKILKSGGRVQRTAMPIAIFDRGGLSTAEFDSTMEEEDRLRMQHYGVPSAVSYVIRRFKTVNASIGKNPTLRRFLRRWV
jgi:hypothetical protein